MSSMEGISHQLEDWLQALGNSSSGEKGATSPSMSEEENADSTDSAAAPSSSSPSRSPPLPPCWGAQLTGSSASCCDDFVGGSNHFKNKFCSNCSRGMEIKTGNVRALVPELEEAFANKKSAGFWKCATQGHTTYDYRIVNNTCDCSGPKLIIFRGTPPDMNYPPLPVPPPLPNPRPCPLLGTLVCASPLLPLPLLCPETVLRWRMSLA